MTDVVHRNPADNASNVKIKSRTDGEYEVLIRDIAMLPGTVETDIAAINVAAALLAGAVSAARMQVDLATTPTANLATLAAAISAARMQVDLATTPTANLATLAAAITSARMQVDLATTPTANLATLAAAITAARMQVDLATTPTANLATLAGSISGGRAQVDLATTPTANLATLAGSISAGRSQVDLSSTINGYLAMLATANTPKFGQVGSIGTGADVQFGTQALARGMVIKNISAAGEILYVSHAATVSSSTSYWVYPGETTPFIECTNATAAFMRVSTGSVGKACYEGS